YSWLYKSKSYKVFAIVIPPLALLLGNLFNGLVVAGTIFLVEIVFAFALENEVQNFTGQK
ncbi:MAG: hypothetical protein Q4D95_02035, partial [Peptoniphilus sp.]|nr:hypothetical protein [Peptoniphilus sp.]